MLTCRENKDKSPIHPIRKIEYESSVELNWIHSKLGKVSTQHIKGHQSGRTISDMATWNIRCDDLATIARNLPKVKEWHLHTSRASLEINKGDVATNIPLTLRQAHGSQAFRAYAQKKYKWSGSTIESIDWPIHGRAIKQMKGGNKKVITKFIHGWLPVNKHASTTTKTLCQICRISEETQEHMIQCNHTRCKKEKDKARDITLKALRSTRGDPVLIDIIYTNCTSEPTKQVKESQYPRRYKSIIISQNKIGWDQVIKGRVTTKFVQHHDQYAMVNKIPTDGEQWMTRIIKVMWEHVATCWKIRNDIVHDNETRESNIEELRNEVSQLYDMKKHIDPCDRHALATDMSKVMKYSPTAMKKWIERIRPKVRAAKKRTIMRTQLNHISIVNYFTKNDRAKALNTFYKNKMRYKGKVKKQTKQKARKSTDIHQKNITSFMSPKRSITQDTLPP